MFLSNWTLIYSRKYNPETKQWYRPEERREAVTDCEELLDLIEKAFVNGEEFTVEVDAWEPSDDDIGGEPPMTAKEMHDSAWKQHQELHS